MNYGTFSHTYHFFEMLFFGKKLERARLEFLNDLKSAKHILILGEGDGRFLKQLTELNPFAQIDSIELSTRMILKAKKRLPLCKNIQFIQADIRSYKLEKEKYDAVVTHFFLDNFWEVNVSAIVKNIEDSLCKYGRWLNTDFYISEKGVKHFVSYFVVQTLYLFFRVALKIEGDKLISLEPLLNNSVLIKTKKRMFLTSELYVKT